MLETSALRDIAQVSEIIRACQAIGVSFSLDDFGTGYSSLTYLKRLPASLLKIDQSFVRGMLQDPEDLAILEGVLGLAGAFRRQVIAEGVETAAHGEMLLRLGCELAQGYHIARPMPAGQLPAWIRAWRTSQEWMDLPAMSRDDIPLLYAAVEHRAWIDGIEACLRGERPMPAMNTHQCRFGQWLHQEGIARYGSHPAIASIDDLHERIHAQADALLRGGDGLDPARLEHLYQLRDALLGQLNGLIAHCGGAFLAGEDRARD